MLAKVIATELAERLKLRSLVVVTAAAGDTGLTAFERICSHGSAGLDAVDLVFGEASLTACESLMKRSMEQGVFSTVGHEEAEGHKSRRLGVSNLVAKHLETILFPRLLLR